MGWWQLDAGPGFDPERFHFRRDVAAAVGTSAFDDDASLRLAEGFAVVVEADACNELALRRFGIRATRSSGAPAAVQARTDGDDRARLDTAWKALREAIDRLAPEALVGLGPPARAIDVEHVERRFALRLPDEFVTWLTLHDGETVHGGPFHWKLECLVGAAGSKAILDALPALGLAVRSDPPVASTWWHPKWFPFAENGAGDHLCLDLAPAPGGRIGQIIEFRHDDDRRPLVASSFAGWLASVAQEVACGDLVATEYGDGSFAGMLPRALLTGSLARLRVRGETERSRSDCIRTEILDNPTQLALQVVPRLQNLSLLRLAPEASGPTRALFRLHQDVAAELQAIAHPGDRPAAILRALEASEVVIALSARAEDVAAILDALARTSS